MKKYLYIASTLLVGIFLYACQTEQPFFFDEKGNSVYFAHPNNRIDTTVNFADHIVENPTKISIPINLKLLGYTSEKNKQVVLKSQAVEGYPEIEVTIPEIRFEQGELKKTVQIEISRPAELDSLYAISVYIDSLATSDDRLVGGVKNYGKYTIYVKEAYTAPPAWDYGIGMYLGKWAAEKHLFMIQVTQNASYYDTWDWSLYPKYNQQAVDSLRKFAIANPDTPIAIDIPLKDDCIYGKPDYWSDLHNRYLGEYAARSFANFASSNGLNTTNERAFFTGDENRMKELNKQAVVTMMNLYDRFFQWGMSSESFQRRMWAPMLPDAVYPVSKPACWQDASAKPLLERYYGEYSDEKYQFMIQTWTQKVGMNNFVLVQLFPVIVGWTEAGTLEAQWDSSIGGETAIKECYHAFKEAYALNPEAYPFTFPDVTID